MKKIFALVALVFIMSPIASSVAFAGCSDDGSVCGPHISSVKIRPYGYYYSPSNSYHYSYNEPWPRKKYRYQPQQTCGWSGCGSNQYYGNNYYQGYNQYDTCGYGGCGGSGVSFQVGVQAGYSSGYGYCDQWGCY